VTDQIPGTPQTMTRAAQGETLLRIEGLRTHIFLSRGVVQAVDGVTLDLRAGESVGLVGESGSGKTMTGLSILRLLPRGSGRIVAGRVELDGVDLTRLSEKEMARDWRGRRVSMVSQDPLTSLNPLFTMADQIGAPLRYHGLARGKRNVRDKVVDLLRLVRIPEPERRLDDYPHQFSGGMRQRAVSAMALAGSPRLMIADEPTSALDVTIQVQLIDLYRRIQAETGLGILMITHDLGVAAAICSRIAVMYAGRIVEFGTAAEIFDDPKHPYTQALIASVPHLGRRKKRLYALPGQPPALINPPAGCRFADRCPVRMAKCATYPPDFITAGGHRTACWKLEDKGEPAHVA
jgi:peptide/nickel transport system ATP-binding protein